MKKYLCILLCLMITGCNRSSLSKEEQQIYIPGTYQQVSNGEYGEMEVEIELSKTKIESITIVSSHDTNGILEEVRSTYIANIIALQNTEIDVVAGATGSCKGVHEALVKVLEENAYEKEAEQD